MNLKRLMVPRKFCVEAEGRFQLRAKSTGEGGPQKHSIPKWYPVNMPISEITPNFAYQFSWSPKQLLALPRNQPEYSKGTPFLGLAAS